ncbi:hypothetical protein ASZ78_001557 [Callipepla squamata]|uniref:THAP-type domain-containing protein n=1 Tax=Callipepla squamata TaxID=9009 RepID=A0A226ND74_CALSU|nr:hypothetical protein ASZ78_001557 [Callipepla squamata]
MSSAGRFPLKDSKRLIQWLKAVQRDNWTPTKYSFLCSEHFTKDSFSRRLEDQHRLLKPTAVPTIFQLAEKKRDNLDYVRSRRKIASQVPLHDEEAPREGGCEVAQRSPSPEQDLMVMQGTDEMDEVTLQAEIGAMSEEEEHLHGQLEGPRRRTFGDSLVAKPGAQKKSSRSSVEDCPTGAWTGSWVADRSGISVDDFTPPASGACKFIGSLHSYSFSSKHTRERPSFPKEQLERKRPKRDVEPSCSSNLTGHDKTVAEDSPTSSLTATPQKPSQGLSASPADLTPQPAAEAVVGQKGDTDANPMSINEVIMSASGACKLIDSLHSYCFSSRQSKSQVCCLREQVEKKNGELKLLRQRISRSDSQVRKLKEKLDELKRISIPYLNSLLSQDCGQYSRGLCVQAGFTLSKQRLFELGVIQMEQLLDVVTDFTWVSQGSRGLNDVGSSFMKMYNLVVQSASASSVRPRAALRADLLAMTVLYALSPSAPWRWRRAFLMHLQGVSCSPSAELQSRSSNLPFSSFPLSTETPQLNPVMEPLSWMLGTWLSDPPGDGTFPTMKPFQYLEEVHISHVGQPMLNFSFNAFHPDTRKPMHRECGFIRLKPDTNKVAFISAQNTGLVEVEEGEVNGQELSIASHSIARISFAKKPHVEQITRKFRLNSDGKLEQTVSMATTTQPMTQHLHITYKKVTP